MNATASDRASAARATGSHWRALSVATISLCLCLLVVSRLLADSGGATPTAVEVVNASRPTRCAEEDNLYVKLVGAGVQAMRIEARHPVYLADLQADSTQPNFTGCDMSGDPAHAFTPNTLVLYEDAGVKLIGHTFQSFWRPNVVPFRVADRLVPGLHLIQVFVKQDTGASEFLVLYPADGYWRLKPLPPRHLADSAYGSSFLIGPVEEKGRPLVEITDVLFEPATRAFHLTFAAGGRARVTIGAIRDHLAALDVRFDPPAGTGPFAALRSMFVTPALADAAEVHWQPQPGAGAGADAPMSRVAIMDFKQAVASSVRFGRSTPSGHNTSAPDLVFHRFERAGPDRP